MSEPEKQKTQKTKHRIRKKGSLVISQYVTGNYQLVWAALIIFSIFVVNHYANERGLFGLGILYIFAAISFYLVFIHFPLFEGGETPILAWTVRKIKRAWRAYWKTDRHESKAPESGEEYHLKDLE